MIDLPAPPLEMSVLVAGIVLLFVHIMLQSGLTTRERGLGWNAGARDTPQSAPGLLAGRAGRALENFKETFPAFAAASLAAVVLDRTGGWSALGSLVWISARLVYLPLYLAGVPYLRGLVWLASLAGILMVVADIFL